MAWAIAASRSLRPEIVGGQFNRHAVVDVAPVGVVLHGFSQQCHPGHEGERFAEILELTLTLQAIVRHLPVLQRGAKLCSSVVR